MIMRFIKECVKVFFNAIKPQTLANIIKLAQDRTNAPELLSLKSALPKIEKLKRKMHFSKLYSYLKEQYKLDATH